MDGSSTVWAGWLGRLELALEERAGVTRLVRQRHQGPLLVQRPFYPEGDALPHLYILHPPGGVVGGDRLEIQIEARARAHALVTTPAAQKLYRSAGPAAVQENRLVVKEDAALEWFPSELIVFDGAHVRSTTRVSLAPRAAFIGWEMGCFGRLTSGDAFRQGVFAQHFEVEREGRPISIERFCARGGSPFLDAAWGLRGFNVVATLCAIPRSSGDVSELVDSLRRELSSMADVLVSVTSVGDALIVRALGSSVEGVRGLLVVAWSLLRPRLLDRSAVRPRIWAT